MCVNEGQKLQLNKHEPHSPCIDVLSFVLIFPHISATISEETHRVFYFHALPELSRISVKEKTQGNPDENKA